MAFSCTLQHGEEECYLNTIHACSINIWPVVVKSAFSSWLLLILHYESCDCFFFFFNSSSSSVKVSIWKNKISYLYSEIWKFFGCIKTKILQYSWCVVLLIHKNVHRFRKKGLHETTTLWVKKHDIPRVHWNYLHKRCWNSANNCSWRTGWLLCRKRTSTSLTALNSNLRIFHFNMEQKQRGKHVLTNWGCLRNPLRIAMTVDMEERLAS